MRSLVLASMPQGAAPDSHIASGPWCFSGREELFPGWEDSFPLPPDPYPDADAVTAAARAANGEALRLARQIGPALFHQPGNSPPLSESYLLMALGPFLLLACHMLAERQKRTQDLVARYGGEALRVAILPEDMPFSFSDSLDFMLRGVQDVTFNHYIYSRILDSLAPPAWQLIPVPAPPAHIPPAVPHPSPAARLKGRLRAVLRDLPFPRCKGFGMGQTLLLSLAVLTNKRTQPDATLDFSLYCGAPVSWRFPAAKIIEACIPTALRQARPPRPGPAGLAPGPLRGMSPSYSQDEPYRLRLAALRERNCRLFGIQHGANYGNLQSVGGLPFEYGQHAFFTWGWSEHAGVPANARPMPHPALCRIAGAHKEQAPRLILVGTEMSCYSYRLKSRTQAGALLRYRRGKVAFLEQVKGCLAAPAELLYRPYFKVAGGLDDGEYVLRNLPGISLCRGDLTEQMLSCRLLVLDHYGTTLHMALAANAPCLAFWHPEDWGMEPRSAQTLDKLRAAGVLHDSPQSAAAKAGTVWQDAQAWWRGSEVQDARNAWLARYANISDATGRPWSSLRLTWKWFRELREC